MQPGLGSERGAAMVCFGAKSKGWPGRAEDLRGAGGDGAWEGS